MLYFMIHPARRNRCALVDKRTFFFVKTDLLGGGCGQTFSRNTNFSAKKVHLWLTANAMDELPGRILQTAENLE